MAASVFAGIGSGCGKTGIAAAVAPDLGRLCLRAIGVLPLLRRPPILLPLLLIPPPPGADCWRRSAIDPSPAPFHLGQGGCCFSRLPSSSGGGRLAKRSRVGGTARMSSGGGGALGREEGDGAAFAVPVPPSGAGDDSSPAAPHRDASGVTRGGDGGDGDGGVRPGARRTTAFAADRPVLCDRCRGEGTSRARLSKRERFRRKRAKRAAANADAAPAAASAAAGVTGVDVDGGGDGTTPRPQPPAPAPPPRMEPCRLCGGSGLLPSSDDLDGGTPTATATAAPTIPAAPRHDTAVAIVGGGIGGCALALALQHRGVPCVVYERDASFGERRQGYGLTMQQGARALRALGFFLTPVDGGGGGEGGEGGGPAVFGIHSRRHLVHTPDGTVLGRWGLDVWGRTGRKANRDSNRQNAHISRQGLRRMLLDRLEPGTVRWGHRFVRYEEMPAEAGGKGGAVEITLRRRRERASPGPAEDEGGLGVGGGDDAVADDDDVDDEVRCTAGVLVGADGIRSAVRGRKLGGEDDAHYPLRYLGCIVILGIAPSPSGSGSGEGGLTDGETVFQTADGTTRIYAMPFSRPGEEESTQAARNRGGETMWQLSFPMSESDARNLSIDGGPDALKREASARCGEWHRPIPELIRSTPVDLVSGYPVYDREVPTLEEFRDGIIRPRSSSSSSEVPSPSPSSSRVTLIGDAAHPMSPFKGQGANQALLDAVQLARSLYRIFDTSSCSSKKETARPDDDDHCDDDGIPDALADFEGQMLKRSSVKVRASAEAAEFLHSEVAVMEGNVTRAAAAAAAAATSAAAAASEAVKADSADSEAA